MTSRALLGAVALWLLAVAIVVQPFRVPAVTAAGSPAPQPATTNGGVYTKKQADAAKAQFDKICADCHPFTVADKKKLKDVLLGDEPFFENWEGRPLAEMITTIALTMPNDGSATVTEQEATDLVAYILLRNGFPAGTTPLSKATAVAIVERPKK